jgi:hypothetical protein
MMQTPPPGDEAPKSDFREQLTPEQRRRIRRETAYHEAGHAVAAYLMVGPSHIEFIDMRGDGVNFEAFIRTSRRPSTISMYANLPLPFLRGEVMKVGIENMMGPFAERYITGESWDWYEFSQMIWDTADSDDYQSDGSFDSPLRSRNLSDADRLLEALQALPAKERYRYMRLIREWTEEFGTHPLVKTAIERLGEMLVEVDFMEGERVVDLLQECFGNVAHFSQLSPAWKRRVRVAMRALRGND